MADAIGPERTGIRLSPYTTFLDAVDEDPVALGSYMAEQLNPLGLAYLHMVEPRVPSGAEEGEFKPDATLAPFRKIYNGAHCHYVMCRSPRCVACITLLTDGCLFLSPRRQAAADLAA